MENTSEVTKFDQELERFLDAVQGELVDGLSLTRLLANVRLIAGEAEAKVLWSHAGTLAQIHVLNCTEHEQHGHEPEASVPEPWEELYDELVSAVYRTAMEQVQGWGIPVCASVESLIDDGLADDLWEWLGERVKELGRDIASVVRRHEPVGDAA